MAYFLITSTQTGKKYKRKTLKKKYKKIESGTIQKVYEIKKHIGIISNGEVFKIKKEKKNVR